MTAACVHSKIQFIVQRFAEDARNSMHTHKIFTQNVNAIQAPQKKNARNINENLPKNTQKSQTEEKKKVK